MVSWFYGSGFPKSLDVSKAIDSSLGAEREIVGYRKQRANVNGPIPMRNSVSEREPLTVPATAAATKWQGWGTALKPACEPIVLARKPLIGTVAKNVLEYGTGAMNIDASRTEIEDRWMRPASETGGKSGGTMGKPAPIAAGYLHEDGRWPANILFDEEAASLLDEQSGESVTPSKVTRGVRPGLAGLGPQSNVPCYGDRGGVSRFFYVAKPSKRERSAGLDGRNIHPTVKPTTLMRYLITMITPPGGTVLDPFTGSGTTGVAAKEAGFAFIGIEREPEYHEIAQKRIEAAQALHSVPDAPTLKTKPKPAPEGKEPTPSLFS
jgi:site-specific DNA-methyltransferase (adenine-specific)